MGLTFHYSGSFKKEASLPELISEVKDIAEINEWKYNIYKSQFNGIDFGKDTFDNNLYGISFDPPQSEPVWICFLSNGKLSTPHLVKFYGKTENQKDRKNLYLVSTKTQHAGVQTH